MVDVNLALHGYDIMESNAFDETGDPGWRSGKIFVGDCEGGNSADLTYYRDFMSIQPVLQCEAELKTQTYRSVMQYLESSTSNFKFKNAFNFELGIAIGTPNFGFKLGVSLSFSAARTSSAKSSLEVLENQQGEIVETRADCITHAVSIGSFARNRFSSDFINGLYVLNSTIDKSVSAQVKAFTDFTRNFGTHYSRKTLMGAGFRYQKIFNERSTSLTQSQERESCMENAFSLCIDFGLRVSAGNVRVKVSFKMCLATETASCSESSSSSSSDTSSSEETLTFISTGSRPVDGLDAWLTSDFQPVPVNMEVAPISDLITQTNLDENPVYGFPVGLDASLLQDFFRRHMLGYCRNILGKTQAECGGDPPQGINSWRKMD
jgi:hypothetical protein